MTHEPSCELSHFPAFNLPLLWPEDDNRALYNGTHVEGKCFGQNGGRSAYTNFGQFGGHCGCVTQLAVHREFPLNFGHLLALVANDNDEDACSPAGPRRRLRRAQQAVQAASLCGRPARKDAMRQLADSSSLQDMSTGALARLPLTLSRLLMKDISAFDPDCLAERPPAGPLGRSCGLGTVAVDGADADDARQLVVTAAAGRNLRQLAGFDLQLRPTRAQQIWRLDTGGVVREIAAGGSLLCVRHSHDWQLLSRDSRRDAPKQRLRVETRAELLSATLSRHVAGEVVTCDEEDVVTLWDCERQVTSRQLSRHLATEPVHAWASGSIGRHYRRLLMASSCQAAACDLRDRASPTVLLEPTRRFCSELERLRSAAFLDGHVHLVGTDFHLFVLDERMPGVPVLQQRTPFGGAPTLLRWQPSLLLIGSQSTCDLAAEPLALSNADSPVRVCSASAQLARPDSLLEESDCLKTRLRLRECSLIGLECARLSGGWLVLQQTGFGDVFAQRLLPDGEGEDEEESRSLRRSFFQQLTPRADGQEATEPPAFGALSDLWLPHSKQTRLQPADSQVQDSQLSDAQLWESSFENSQPPLREPSAACDSALPPETLRPLSLPADSCARDLLTPISPTRQQDAASEYLVRLWRGEDVKAAARRREMAHAAGHLRGRARRRGGDQLVEEEGEGDGESAASGSVRSVA